MSSEKLVKKYFFLYFSQVALPFTANHLPIIHQGRNHCLQVKIVTMEFYANDLSLRFGFCNYFPLWFNFFYLLPCTFCQHKALG